MLSNDNLYGNVKVDYLPRVSLQGSTSGLRKIVICLIDKRLRTYPKIITEALEPNTSPTDPVAERPALFAGMPCVSVQGKSKPIADQGKLAARYGFSLG